MIHELVVLASMLGVEFCAEGDRVLLRDDDRQLTTEIREFLGLHKAEVLSVLRYQADRRQSWYRQLAQSDLVARYAKAFEWIIDNDYSNYLALKEADNRLEQIDQRSNNVEYWLELNHLRRLLENGLAAYGARPSEMEGDGRYQQRTA